MKRSVKEARRRAAAGGRGGVARFTVSLPRDTFDRGERERHGLGLNRSEFVSRLYRAHLEAIEDERRAARYAAAYERQPESLDEQWIAERSAALLFADGEASTGGSEE